MSPTVKALLVGWLAAGLLGPPIQSAPAAPRDDALAQAFLADCEALLRTPHRLAGTPEGRQATEYIRRRLEEMGIEDIYALDLPVWQTRVERCELRLGGKTVSLLPARPDLIVPPVTPDEGLTGPFIYAGHGRLEDYRDRSPEGAVVALEYDCADGWEEAFRLGAKAVIFLGDREATSIKPKHVTVPANLVRLYAPAEAQQQVDLRRDWPEATVVSHIVWKRLMGTNLFAFLPGTNPVFNSEHRKPEMVVLAAHCDTFGAVPDASPGARGAANVAALLEAAAHFQRHRPRRDILLAFLDNQARSLEGAREFYTTLMIDGDLAEGLADEHNQEFAFVRAVMEMLGREPTAWESEAALRDAAIKILTAQSDYAWADLKVQLMSVTRQLREMRQAGEPDQPAVGRRKALQEQRTVLTDGIAEWDVARRLLHNRQVEAMWTRQEKDNGEPEAEAVWRKRQALYVRMRDACLAQLGRRLQELDDLIRQDEQRRNLRRRLGERWTALHVDFNLSGGGPTWGVVVSDALLDFKQGANTDSPGAYVRVLAALREAAARTPSLAALDAETLGDPSQSTRFGAGTYVSDGRAAGVYGIYNVTVMTGNDSRPRDGHPADTLDHLDWRALRGQAAEAARLVQVAADLDGLSLPRVFSDLSLNRFSRWDAGKRTASGNFAGLQVTGSLREDRPAAGAILAFWPYGGDSAGRPWWNAFTQSAAFDFFDPFVLEAVDANGRFRWFGVHKNQFEAYFLLAAVFDARGRVVAITNQEKLVPSGAGTARVDLFPTGGYVVGRAMAGDWSKGNVQVLHASANAPFRDTQRLTGQEQNFAFFYIHKYHPATRVKVFHPTALAFLGRPLQTPTGEGYPFGRFLTPPPADPDSATDLWQLNETRLGVLRTRGIVAGDLEILHSRARLFLDQVAEAGSLAERQATLGQSESLSRRIYAPLRDNMNDLVKAIVMLLLLAIPFAFVMERLVLCATNIYMRLAGFAAIFMVMFGILYWTHPGFQIAATPIIIFLAFLIILLSSLVIFIVTRKFQTELRAMQGQSSARHEVQLSRLSTLIAAVNMGISTMRRRPVRTILTAVTVVMLTFTILCFASLTSEVGVQRLVERPPGDDAAGVFLRRLDYKAMNTDVLALLHGREGRGGLVAGHWWLVRQRDDDVPFGVGEVVTGRSLWLDGIMGIQPEELEHWPRLAEIFEGEDTDPKVKALGSDGVYLPRVLRDKLALAPGDEIFFCGTRCRFAGTFDDRRLQRLNHLDGRSVLPVDFRDPSSVIKEEQLETASEDVLARDFRRLNPNQVAIASADLVRRLGGAPHVIIVYAGEKVDPGEIGPRIAEQVSMPVWANATEGVQRLLFTQLTEVSGGLALVVPVLLGGMIIFGTMLGSIADREREIYSFSALGLGPVDVGFLFFAEAAVYAVVGGMVGQLLAQGLAMGALRLAEAGYIQPTSINFSSTNALFAIGVVMVTVLVSAVYPAVRASRSANPGLARSWRMPSPEGDVLAMTFPFTVSAYDITGVVSFLAEHFRQHNDAGLGVFAAQDVRVERAGKDGRLRLSAHLALAPFDLGVTQTFELTAVASEIPGVDEVVIRAERQSGAVSDWKRGNRVFLHDLRRQFLLWRTLTPEAVESYRMETLAAFGKAGPPEGESA